VEFNARAVICATGGLTYRVATAQGIETTNPLNDNHVLFDALAGLGLPQLHEEHFQFQPFGVVDFGVSEPGRCVPESIVGQGVRIVDRHGNDVCDVRSDRLAVTEAILAAVRRGDAIAADNGRSGVRLTLSDVAPEVLAAQFPKVHALLRSRDRVGDDVLVYPFLHYQLGGFAIAPDCSTKVPGLFLAGEMTGGLHGRNRLMGNGITDALVHGRVAALAALEHLRVSRG
jgi:succinate dehydrogenase/fumarate reductase flavoprotein subunit